MTKNVIRSLAAGAALALAAAPLLASGRPQQGSKFLGYRPPAGDLASVRHAQIDGLDAAVINSGRIVTPPGVELSVQAPKPFGLALSPNGTALATINSGTTPFSITLVTNLASATPTVKLISVNATFMGVAFSPDGTRFYASGGDNGNIWIGDTSSATIVGSVNLNGAGHPLDRPLDPVAFGTRVKGTFPGRMTLSPDGRWLYVVDQGAFQINVIDTTKITVGVDATGKILEPDNFAAVANRIATGRYPFDVALSTSDNTLYVANVGTFQFHHLMPGQPTGDRNVDYPLCYPGAGYPDETAADRSITISPVDPRNLPLTMRDPNGIRCGYVKSTQSFVVPGLGSPNAPESNSVWSYDVKNPLAAARKAILKTGPVVAEQLRDSLQRDDDDDAFAYAGAHPNSLVASRGVVYIANGNDDSVVAYSQKDGKRSRIALTPLSGFDASLRGVQPVALALSPDGNTLYVAEAGLNAVGVIAVNGIHGRVLGHIPTGWWPSSLAISPDGKRLYVANAKGRGAGPNTPNPPDDLGSAKSATIGSLSIIPIPDPSQLDGYTDRVLRNAGLVSDANGRDLAALQQKIESLRKRVKHFILVNKENATHDLILGDITATSSGQAVRGEPSYSLGESASPNHHKLALEYAFSDNFFLEPSVSSDGHRWLTNTYTSEFEETHWPASYGGARRDSGDDATSFLPYPGRLGFTDANSSPDPNDINEHGGVYLHLVRHGKSFVNFGNGYEFAEVDEDVSTDPTGIRNHVNVPMEKLVRDHSDHLYPEFNTGIPDAPLPEDPGRFSRFGRFKQIFDSQFVNGDSCLLPDYVDLYYPNDHGGGSNDIFPDGSQPWSFTRFVQDNDDALGRTVDLVSNSPCWDSTVIFVVEDDTQNGFDHVDAYRSIFLAIGPSVKEGYLVQKHISLESVFKTIDLVFGLPPLNLYEASAADLLELWPDTMPDEGGDHGHKRAFARAEIKPDTSRAGTWARETKHVEFDTADVDELNLREAIRRSEGLPRIRKKAEGRFP